MHMNILFKKLFLALPIIILSFDVYSDNHTVKMLNQGATGVMVFEPAFLKINVGDTVTFESTDPAHNSASIPGMIPAGANSWNGQLSRDVTVTFDIPGVYGYQCTPHAMMAMVGVIQVGDPVNMSEIEEAAQNMKASFAMNTQRLEQYLSAL